MKRILILLLIITALVGCSDKDTEAAQETESNKEEVQKSEQPEENKVERSNEEIQREGELIEIGQTVNGDTGKVELINIKEFNETIEQGPLKIEMINAKLIENTNSTQAFKQHLSQFVSHEVGDEVTYIQIRYNVENTSDGELYWSNLKNIVTDQKEQINADMEEFLLQSYETEFLGNVQHDYVQSFVIKNSDINEVKLVFNAIENLNSYEKITDEIEYNFTFD
ncbi:MULTISPECIES: hypothetical protein [unclassified Oceanobacillus]|uniref:hypothetical protein n=1 Tax=unclassified Oceanobacillus TaxID=2630292 RepID=UPI001BE55A70|nr:MULTISPECIES: hypothetical protein [unclassified Oceanobacillus]MBT2600923.1 hypothetical protein [Oceanobacillus sp. ISL-74]MBT2653626.1 hypothetical protein [Oceanobacillus sp. ISL-73]